MKGWKTWTSAGIVMVVALLEFLGYGSIVGPLYAIAAAFGVVGLGHKLEKASKD